MKTLGIVSSLIALAAGFAVALPSTATATTTSCTWRSSSLPIPPGANQYFIRIGGTDHNGGWAGKASMPDRDHVFAWKNGTIVDYGPTPMAPGQTILTQASVADENRSGTILVNLFVSPYQQLHPPYQIRNGQWQQLTPLPGATHWEAAAINDAGDVLGTNWVARNGTTGEVVVRWPAGQTAAVEVPGIPFKTRAIDLDEDGTMLVGVRNPTTGSYDPNIVRGGVRTTLQPLSGTTNPDGVKISNGRVIGNNYPKSGVTAVVWERDLTPHALPNSDFGKLINRDGLAIGTRDGGGTAVWRNGVLEFSFGSADMGAISDDGTFAVTLNDIPTVWRCS
jgi:hypothetical protein